MAKRGRRPRILVSNDDGYDTSGIRELAKALAAIADVYVCAPMHDNSTASSRRRLPPPDAVRISDEVSIMNSSPADCVHAAILQDGVAPWRPVLTVAGINNGCNLGDDTIYSGTVSAAAESVMLGVPAIAFSLACLPQDSFPATHFADAAQIARDFVARTLDFLVANPRTMLNVNIPDLEANKVLGPKVCALGRRHPGRPVRLLESDDRLSLRRFKIGVGQPNADEAGTDFAAVENGHVSVTPLQFNLTEKGRIDALASWLSGTRRKRQAKGDRARILVSNDDGYSSPAMLELVAGLRRDNDVHICAPLSNMSCASSSLTLFESVTVSVGEDHSIVHGTPTDCVHLALVADGLLPWKPDLTVSGVNLGLNLGEASLYSGTVAAAAESLMLGVPSIAFSQGDVSDFRYPEHYDGAAQAACDIVNRLKGMMMEAEPMMVNVNMPDLPHEMMGAVTACPLGFTASPDWQHIPWEDDGDGQRWGTNDIEVVSDAGVSATPLMFDLTDTGRIDEVRDLFK